MSQLKTPDEVKKNFDRFGISISAWAREHGLPRQIVSDVLKGRAKGRIGAAHKAAVLLGLKEGEIRDDKRNDADTSAV